MNPFDVWLISVVVGGAAGVVGGVAVNWFLDSERHEVDDDDGIEPLQSGPSLDARVDEAASSWAQQHGRPGTERLVAEKLRLGLRLQQRRVSNARRRGRGRPW